MRAIALAVLAQFIGVEPNCAGTKLLAYNGELLFVIAQIMRGTMPWEVCLNYAIKKRRSKERLRYNPVETCGYTPQSRQQ